MREIPKSERPRERLKQLGTDPLTDTELLSIVLGSETSILEFKQVSGRILSEHSFHSLLNVSREELEDFDGVSTKNSCEIKAVAEIARRMQRQEKERIESLEDLKTEVLDMKFLSREKLRLFLLNSGNEVIKRINFKGDVKSVKVDIQDILKPVVSKDAAAFIIAHNHPSGEPTPTRSDKTFTETLNESAETLGVDLLDHIIVGKEIFSFKRDSTEVL